MRLRPLNLAVAGCLSIGLMTGVAAVATAAPAAFTASAVGWGPSTLIAVVNATNALNQQYTGCTNVHVNSLAPDDNGWLAVVQGTCTGTA